jgi:ubiquinone/menaquinone biosynthesis C-methylase UbiE
MSELKYIPFEEEAEDIKIKVTDYWTERADSFLVQRQRELESSKAAQWLKEITAWLPDPKSMDKPVSILDVGCGAGYFTVLLGKAGYQVTCIDLTREMIVKAEELIQDNGPYQETVCVKEMDAEKLSFEDESFDAVVTRNLTWTLPHPIEAYQEWYRVLKKGGMLLNFDAEYAKNAHSLFTVESVAHKDISDKLKEDCHELYHMLTISTFDRPEWDKEVLTHIGFSEVRTDLSFADRIFAEKDEFYIPDKMFMITAEK